MNQKEKDKIVTSVARFIAGLKPTSGRNYYFQKLRLRTHIPKANGNVCPLCDKKVKYRSYLVFHIIKRHRSEILHILGLD